MLETKGLLLPFLTPVSSYLKRRLYGENRPEKTSVKEIKILSFVTDSSLFYCGRITCPAIQRLLRGMLRLIAEPDFLITDYFVIGGIGAAFLNACCFRLSAFG